MFGKSIQKKLCRETGLRVKLSVQTILFGLQNCTFARFKVYYINHIILIAKICIRIFKKTETVNSLHIICEKQVQLRNITRHWNKTLHYKKEHIKHTEGFVNYTLEYV